MVDRTRRRHEGWRYPYLQPRMSTRTVTDYFRRTLCEGRAILKGTPDSAHHHEP
jgi:hypothetical protein